MRVASLDGFKFLCHLWVVAVHCFPAIHFWDGLMRNLDAGSFFVITGFTSHLSLKKKIISNHRARSMVVWWLERSVVISLLGFIFTLIPHFIFPYRHADRHDILPYMLTFTHPFLHHFNKDRLDWNPNPPIWFIDICFWAWLLHPIIYYAYLKGRDMTTKVIASSETRGRIWSMLFRESDHSDLLHFIGWYGVLCLALFTLAATETHNAIIHTGWSYHWLPRFLQYTMGVWVGSLASSPQIEMLMTIPDKWLCQTNMDGRRVAEWIYHMAHRLAKHRHITKWSADVFFITLTCIYLLPPRREDPMWSTIWLPRAVGVTALEALLMVSLVYNEYGVRNYTNIGSDLEASTPETTDEEEQTDNYREKCVLHVKRKLLDSPHCVCSALWSASWFKSVAPSYTNSLTYLAHFPLVWQPVFDKNDTMKGHKSLFYILTLWWGCLILNKGAEQISGGLHRTLEKLR